MTASLLPDDSLSAISPQPLFFLMTAYLLPDDSFFPTSPQPLCYLATASFLPRDSLSSIWWQPLFYLITASFLLDNRLYSFLLDNSLSSTVLNHSLFSTWQQPLSYSTWHGNSLSSTWPQPLFYSTWPQPLPTLLPDTTSNLSQVPEAPRESRLNCIILGYAEASVEARGAVAGIAFTAWSVRNSSYKSKINFMTVYYCVQVYWLLVPAPLESRWNRYRYP
jgi:hypothetical protein